MKNFNRTKIDQWAKKTLEERGCSMMVNVGLSHSTGWPQLLGYSSQGLMILCEIMPNTGLLSNEVREQLFHLQRHGGLAYVAAEDPATNELRIYTVAEYVLR